MRSGRPCTQIFLLRSPDLPGVDKAALRKEVLDHVEQNSELLACRRPCCTACMGKRPGTLRCACFQMQPCPCPCMHALACADLAPLYSHVCSHLGWALDAAKHTAMQAKNQVSTCLGDGLLLGFT